MADTDPPTYSPVSPCVGRIHELDTLWSQWDLAREGVASFCRVTGDAGSGKSTLLQAFASSLENGEHPVVIASAYCDKQLGEIRPLAPWSEILQSLSGMTDIAVQPDQISDNKSVTKSIQSAIAELAPDLIELLIPGVGLVVRSAKLLKRSALGERLSANYMPPEEIIVAADKSRLQDQYIAIIEQVLDRTPLVIVLDDLDSSDEASLQLLARLVAKTRSRKVMFLVATRHNRIAEKPGVMINEIADSAASVSLDLDAAVELRGEEFVAEYVNAVVPGVDKDFVGQLFSHTGGQPLFVAELIEHLRGHRHILPHAGYWEASENLNWREVPGKIESVLAEQWRGLDSELADILQVGSVEGDQFSIEVVAKALNITPISVARALSRRAPKSLVVPLASRRLGRGRATLFRFSHSLARHHIYAQIEPLERPFLHEAVASGLEFLAGDQPEIVAAQLAHQFEQAGIVDKAGHYYEMAAGLAIATCSMTEAAAHLRLAQAQRNEPLDLMRIKAQLARIELMVGQVQRSAQLYLEARTIAEREGAEELVVILADEALALARVNDVETAWETGLRAERLARQQGNAFGLLSALQTLAHIHSKSGRHLQALELQAEALALAMERDNDTLMAQSLSKQGWYLKELGRYDEAHKALQRSLEIQNRGQPNYSQLATTCNALADIYISQGNYLEARRNLLLAIDSWRQFDRNTDVAVGLSNLANLSNREGFFEEALEYGRQAYEEDLQVMGDDHPELAFSLTCIGESLIGTGDYEPAVEYLRKAYDLRQRHSVPESNLAWSRWLLGRALVESGVDVPRGRKHIQEARLVLGAMGVAAQSEVKDIDGWLADHPG